MRSSVLMIFCIGCLGIALPARLSAQAEHVGVDHPVYSFLNRLQVRGMIEGYSRSALPLERKQVTELLRAADAASAELSAVERELLARFHDEFVAEADGTQQPVVLFATSPGDAASATFSDREKFLYRWQSENRAHSFFMEFLGSLEYRTLLADDGDANVTLGQVGGRFRGTLGGVFGYDLAATNGTASGNRSLALRDPQLRRNFTFGTLDNPFFDFSEAVISGSWEWGSVALGREKRLSGTGHSNLAVLSSNAQTFDALELRLHRGDVRFSFLHGSLLSELEMLEGGRPWYDAKYVAMHRLEADLFGALRAGVFESVIYSGREMDFAYLNPVNFYKSAEHAGGDRDNPLLGFELSSLGIPDAELYGTWLLDDVDFGRLGESWWGNKFIFQTGVTSTHLSNTDVTVEYTRINPYVYTHRLPGNQYTQHGESLGLEIPPNSDELYASVRYWFSAALWLQLEYRHRRHGRNETDAEGNVIVNHGADIYESLDYERDSEIAPFLDGPRDDTDLLTLLLRWEPWRNIIFAGQYRWRDRRSAIDGDHTDHYLSLGMWIEY
ncbi:MAG: hypothetical protein JXA28_10435 [Bacteroidetes bacterium]|nr:hypothetical protein [Bacteroidota bacterium]